jgi:uncharacterized protein (DUF2147 family)
MDRYAARSVFVSPDVAEKSRDGRNKERVDGRVEAAVLRRVPTGTSKSGGFRHTGWQQHSSSAEVILILRKDLFMRILNLIVPAAAVLILAPASAFAGSDPTGIWMNDTGRGAVEIKPCGDAMCGNVVWVKSASDASGCGKPVIGNVKSVGGGRWDNGWIYSPENARKYDVELTPLSNGNLKVLGYAGMKFLSKTMIWKPAPKDLQLCGQTEAKTQAKTETPAAKNAVITTASITPLPAAATPTPVVRSAAADPVTATPAANDAKTTEAQAPTAPADQTKSADTNNSASDDQTASGDDDKNNGIADALGKLKIGDLSMDKVLTKTKSGKCKLDTPWFKVTLNCPQE